MSFKRIKLTNDIVQAILSAPSYRVKCTYYNIFDKEDETVKFAGCIEYQPEDSPPKRIFLTDTCLPIRMLRF
jgi:hypothetical protein